MVYDVTCSLVIYKNKIEIVRAAIESFLDTKLSVHLFIIDNSPTDELKSLVVDGRISYMHNPSNPGFGAAHNIIMKDIWKQSRYHLVLNPDIYFTSGNIEKSVEFMDNNLDVGHMMPKVLYPDGSLQYLCKTNPTPFDLFARRFMPKNIQRYFKIRMDNYEYRNRNYEETMYNIPFLSGCFMLLRSELLKQVGLFDDRIFMYIEDADLTRRFLRYSKTAYYPYAVVYHHFAKGSHKSWRLTWYSIHGAIIYFNKWGWFSNNNEV